MTTAISRIKKSVALLLMLSLVFACSGLMTLSASAAGTGYSDPLRVYALLGIDGDEDLGAIAVLYGKAANADKDNYAILIKVHAQRETGLIDVIGGDKLEKLLDAATYSTQVKVNELEDLTDDLDDMDELDFFKKPAIVGQLQKALESGKSFVTVKDCPWVLPDAIALAKGGGENFRINCDTMNDGKVDVRMTFYPAKATKGIVTVGGTDTDHLEDIIERYGRTYSNKLTGVELFQEGSFGTSVRISAKVNLKGLDTNNLVFYSYNTLTNKHSLIEKPRYKIDDKGYLQFYTSRGGAILITDKELTKK